MADQRQSSSYNPISSTRYHALRDVPTTAAFGQGDVLVLFGELFQRGYANGLVEAAQKRGMTVIYATVGRREANKLRALNDEELATQPRPLINVALEAGFDLEPDAKGKTPVDFLAGLGLKDWENGKLDWASVNEARLNGRNRFRAAVKEYLTQLEPLIPAGANVLFAHLMAGGVPRTKIVMPIMNRVFKGTGDRHYPSEKFWGSDIGKLCAMNFEEVTAGTFDQLLELSSALRTKIEGRGRKVAYTAYGYHGTEVLFDGAYRWQTYTPYLQGFAKMKLEDHAQAWSAKGVKATVYNCPEILTNSSSIFQGVEMPLYPLLRALQKDCPETLARGVWEKCQALLKPGETIEGMLKLCEETLTSPELQSRCNFENWPEHNYQAQMERVLAASDGIFEMHIDQKKLVTSVLSEVVFGSCGEAMLLDSGNPKAPVSWINHDLVCRLFARQ